MCRGLGSLQRKIMATLPIVARVARLTMPGEQERTVKAVWVVDLAVAIYGPNHTRSEFVQTDAATRRLARTGQAERILISYKGDHGFRTRAYIAITEDEP